MRKEIDLHGLYPDDINITLVSDQLSIANEEGYDEVIFIHGHGKNRNQFINEFTSSNTGVLGRAVREVLRRDEVRDYMLVKFDCRHEGSTTVQLRRSRR